mgnify:CR=1 FL=1|jgi:regulatory protein
MPQNNQDQLRRDIEKTLTQTALRYLGYRDRFKQEIIVRLKKQIAKKDYPVETLDLIPNVMAKLEKAGLLDDQDLIDRYIKSQQESKLRGPFVIKQKLFQMGANREQVDRAINKLVTSDSQSLSIDKLIKKYQPNLEDFKSVMKFQHQLIYRGFNLGLIKKKIALLAQKE